MRQMKAWEVLEKAADAIDKYGHRKNALGSRHHGMCAQGAMLLYAYLGIVAWPAHVTGFQRMERALAKHPALYGAMRALQDAHAGHFCYTPDWNNAPERTPDEVTSLMRAVAASLKAARTEGARQHVAESTDAHLGAENADALI